MTLIGAIGFLCGIACAVALILARRMPARGGILIRRLGRVMVSLHLALGLATIAALILLPMGAGLHRAAGIAALAGLSLTLGLRWRALLNRGREMRWTWVMRLWVAALVVSLWAHAVLGWSGWLAVGLITAHVVGLWPARRVVADGMAPRPVVERFWPGWLAAVRAEAGGRRIRRFGARWRIPPF